MAERCFLQRSRPIGRAGTKLNALALPAEVRSGRYQHSANVVGLESMFVFDPQSRSARFDTPAGTEAGGPLRAVPNRRCLANAAAFSLVFLATAILALHPDWLNRPVAKAINNLTLDWEFANVLAFGVAYPTLQGLAVVSLVWCCWFSGINAGSRAHIVSGTFAAILAGFIAYLVHQTLPTSPQPIFDPLLQLHVPAVFGDIDTTLSHNSHTFPSERATMLAGLAIAVFLIRPKLGLLALGCTMLADVSRVYLGLHYPTDIIGSYSLAAAIVWLAQMQWISELGLRFVSWESISPSTFYMCAFVAYYQVTTAFQDLRDLAGILLR
jgi:membrane-associated phospholipid phosphatase